MRYIASILVLAFSSYTASAESLCNQWSEPVEMGSLPEDPIEEASGLIATPFHLLNINDSGSAAKLYWTTQTGDLVKTHRLSVDRYYDTEALAVFKTPETNYIIVGDIGDNHERRGEALAGMGFVANIIQYPMVELHVFKSKSLHPDEAPEFSHTIKVKYPDGPHNAESMAVHPTTGDLFILTKESRFDKYGHRPSQLFRFTKSQWLTQRSRTLTIEKVRDLPIHEINAEKGDYGKLATGMDISPDGKFLLILTYDNALEFKWESVIAPSRNLVRNRDYSEIPTKNLTQEEAISYLEQSPRTIIYTTEVGRSIDSSSSDSPIIKQSCIR
ncbi:MAG: hypothetical protein CL677_08655 [Bdellovibrionaceae bacterium]|nr:hypothetical protein [Pseudobdellovibrionaceae bacterium]